MSKLKNIERAARKALKYTACDCFETGEMHTTQCKAFSSTRSFEMALSPAIFIQLVDRLHKLEYLAERVDDLFIEAGVGVGGGIYLNLKRIDEVAFLLLELKNNNLRFKNIVD